MENTITYEQVLALFAKTDAQIAKTDAQIAKTNAQFSETKKELAETGRYIKDLARRVADVTDTMGRYAEEQVRPKILELFKARGVELEETYPRVVIKKDGQFLLEIDLLLVNTIYSVVVEVKNTLRHKDVDEHIERLEKLQLSSNRTIRGTTMYGAVAGMIVTDEVEQYAIKKGLYVIKSKGDNVMISNKKNFEPKGWEVFAK